MVTLFKRPGAEESLDARIAGVSQRRTRINPEAPPDSTAPPPEQPNGSNGAAAPAPALTLDAGTSTPNAAAQSLPSSPRPDGSGGIEERLVVAREELIARLTAEIRPERRALLSRSDLAKLVSGAVQAYFVRHAVESNPLARRDLVTDIIQALITGPAPAAATMDGGSS